MQVGILTPGMPSTRILRVPKHHSTGITAPATGAPDFVRTISAIQRALMAIHQSPR
jgi:hypothetical protein